jgi:hypothetical protein
MGSSDMHRLPPLPFQPPAAVNVQHWMTTSGIQAPPIPAFHDDTPTMHFLEEDDRGNTVEARAEHGHMTASSAGQSGEENAESVAPE